MLGYVLFLQEIRQSCPSFVVWIMVAISEFVVIGAPIIAAYITLCVDKSKGAFIALNFGTGHIVNDIIKMTACVYRPWVKDSRIKLATQVESSSGGYSMPSGHTSGAVEFYGSVAIIKNNKKWWIVSSLLIVLTAFSRNFLGAHTLFDVLAAILENILILLVSARIYSYIKAHEDKDIFLFVFLFLLGIASMIYVLNKSYPMDYLEDGTLLVDPMIMVNSFMKDLGLYLGIVTGWIVMRRFGKFSVEGTSKEKSIRFIVAIIPTAIMFFGLGKAFELFLDTKWSSFIGRFITFFWIMGIYPVILARFQKRKKEVNS